MMVRQYATALAFKQALEHRFKASSTTGADFARRRQLLVFQRFLARLAQVAGETVTLKGGLVLELRLTRARTTKDVDLRMMGSSSEVLARCKRPGGSTSVTTGPSKFSPTNGIEMLNDGMRYEGYRYRAESRLAGKVYGRPFGVDVAFGDPLIGEPDVVMADDTLGFAGINPPALRLYPVVSHIAEKLHALTMPRSGPSSRVRDLPDIALLATTGPIEGHRLRQAIDLTFEFRNTHPVPASIPEPLDSWDTPYAAMAIADELTWRTLREVAAAVVKFLEPVLGANTPGTWKPSEWRWVDSRSSRGLEC